jgi:hypothetical protein
MIPRRMKEIVQIKWAVRETPNPLVKLRLLEQPICLDLRIYVCCKEAILILFLAGLQLVRNTKLEQ